MALPIDASMFPRLSTRKALIVVDAQTDFLSPDGALPVGIPADLTERIVRLAKDFRPHGPIVWVRTELDRPRPASSEQILTSDAPMVEGRRATPRDRRPQMNPHDQEVSSCPEAFLSGGDSSSRPIVRQGTDGADFPPAIKEIIDKKDITFVKSHYSTFKSPDLVQRLRMKLVTEVYLCGSLTNIGVQATAMDAAGYGLDITIVEDCCGHRNIMRHKSSLKQITNYTGCEAISADDVLDLLNPNGKRKRNPPKPPVEVETLSSKYSLGPDSKASEGDSEETPTKLDAAIAKMKLRDEPVKAAEAAAKARAKAAKDRERLLKGSLGGFKASPDDDLNAVDSEDEEDESLDNEFTKVLNARGKRYNQSPSNTDHKESRPPRTICSTNHNVPKETEPKLDSLNSSESFEPADTSKKEPNQTLGKEPKQISSDITSDELAQAMEQKINLAEDTGAKDNTTMDYREKNQKESEPLCEGDTNIIYNVLPEPLSENIFERIRDEVRWKRMSHQGGEVPRLVAVQGEVDKDGNFPIYRHPADKSPALLPFSSTVREIKEAAEKNLGHPLNHALIQFYRDGNDYISEHSDKTLDIVKGSFIVNVSLGAERMMIFRTKRPPKDKDAPKLESTANGLQRQTHRVPLTHNSMCKLGLVTNERWLHAIRQDKRLDFEKSEAELAYGKARISLTFRQIGTFLDRDSKLIWGQGAKAKTKEEAREVVNGQSPEAVRMLQAFGCENQSTEFDWNASYGEGFDVLHISASPRLYTSSDPVINMRIQLMLAEYGVSYANASMSPLFKLNNGEEPTSVLQDLLIRFADNDLSKSTVEGDFAIMLYIDSVYGKGAQAASQPEMARKFTRFQQGLAMLTKYRVNRDSKALKRDLDTWEQYADESDFIAGSLMSLADFAFWPVLYEIAQSEDGLSSFKSLKAYYDRVRELESCKKVLTSLPGKEDSPKKGRDSEEDSEPQAKGI